MRGAELNQGRCAVVLTPPARQAHLAVLGAFAEAGRAPLRAELERIARGQGAGPGVVLAELAGRDVLAFHGSGEIRAAYPFSPSPTPVQVTWGAARASTRCAPSMRSACPPCWTARSPSPHASPAAAASSLSRLTGTGPVAAASRRRVLRRRRRRGRRPLRLGGPVLRVHQLLHQRPRRA